MTFTDAEFLRRFEDKSLPPEAFDHRGHLRLAWLYLRDCDPEQAVAKTTAGIAAYAAHLGAADKFHHTLTEAVVRIMSARLARCRTADLETYLRANRDLVEDLRGVLLRRYRPQTLDSALARRQFLPPDLAGFA